MLNEPLDSQAPAPSKQMWDDEEEGADFMASLAALAQGGA